MSHIYWKFGAILCTILIGVKSEISIPKQNLSSVNFFCQIICASQIKTLHVYFENETLHGETGPILQNISNCGISSISMRKFKKQPFPQDKISDDGILMYFLIIHNDITQPLEISLIKKKSAAKHLSHVILYIIKSHGITKTWLRNTFHRFWKLWILNVVIIYKQENRLQIYRYNPFTTTYLIKLHYTDALPKFSELFPKTLPNMRRRPLRICIYPNDIRAIYDGHGNVYGTDGLLSSYIIERLNATRVVDRAHPYGKHSISADICFAEIAREYDDISMNLRFLSLESFNKSVEHTIAHNRDDMCIIVPKAKLASTFWNLFRSFDIFVWISLLMSVIIANVFCEIAHRGHAFLERMPSKLFAASIAQTISQIPRLSSHRVFFIFWIYFGMLIGTAFRGNLTSILMFHKSLPDINTIQELAMSSYDILLRPRHVKHVERFLNTDHPSEALIKRQMKVVPDFIFHDEFRKNNVTVAYLEKYNVAAFETSARKHMSYGHPIFHLMQTCLVPFHAVYIVPYGSPYLGFFNFLIRSAHEFGFERYWDRIMNTAFIKSGTTVARNRKNNNDKPVVLALHHFQAVFCLWTMGIMLALLVFIYEIVKSNLTKTQNMERTNKTQFEFEKN